MMNPAFKANNSNKLDPLQQISAGGLLDKNFPQRKMVIDPWFREGETALIWAGSGIGKTMLTLTLAIAMAGGGKVWQWECKRPRKVMIIDGEMNQQDLQERISTLSKTAIGGLDIDTMRQNLTIIARQAQSPDSIFYDVTDPSAQSKIIDRCRRYGIEVLIIDNLSTVADGLTDENDVTAFRSVQGFLLRMKQTGITTILVHHARKDGQEPRGSTALLTTFEVVLGLKRPAIAPSGVASFTTNFTKFRAQGGDATASRTWTLKSTGWDVEEDTDDILQAVATAVKSLKFCNQNELAIHFNVAKGTISKRLFKATASGLLKKEDMSGYWSQAAAYRRADQGTNEADFGEEAEIGEPTIADCPF